MAFTTLADVQHNLPGIGHPYSKQGLTITSIASATTRWTTYWQTAGMPNAGVTPGATLAGTVCTNDTVGAWKVTEDTNPTPRAHIAGIDFIAQGHMIIMIADRIWESGIFPAATVGAQAFTGPDLTTRHPSGRGIQLWWHVYAVMGAGVPTITVTATNSAGITGRTLTYTATAAEPANRTGLFIANTEGDLGYQSVQSWNSNATMTSGSIGLVARKPIATLHIMPGRNTFDFLQLGLEPIPFGGTQGACLEVLCLSPGGTLTAHPLLGHLRVIQG
jgi:hypothetical protein